MVKVQQISHRQHPEANVQRCPTSPRIRAPSRKIGLRLILSAGIGGNIGITAALVRTINLDRLRLAAISCCITGDGCGWRPTAAFASSSACWLPMASNLAGPSGCVSGLTCAGTLRTTTRLLHSVSETIGFITPAYLRAPSTALAAASLHVFTTFMQSDATSQTPTPPAARYALTTGRATYSAD